MKECRCYKDECAECMERYRVASIDFDQAIQPGGRIHRKMQQIREAVDRLVQKRSGGA